jgi:chitin disaccharide deacetylase
VNTKYLIINADDGGLSPETDEGILDTIRAGVVTSVSLLVNPPFSAPITAFTQSGVSLGLHLNLTLGQPCTRLSAPSLVDQDGRFHAHGYKNPLLFDAAAVKAEFLNQLDQFRNLTGADPTHLDLHKHLHRRSMVVLSVVMEIAAGLNVPVRCLDETMRTACRAAGVMATDQFLGDVVPAPYWTLERLKTELDRLSPGIAELMCHPGNNRRPVEGLTYVVERNEERRTFSSSEARELLAPFQLVNFRTAPFRRMNV